MWKRKSSRWECWTSNATETSEEDAGWEEAIGICHYKAISDITGSHPVEKSRQRKAWCHCGLKKAWRLWAVRHT